MPVHTNTCNTHCTAGRKMTLRGNDVWLAKSDTSTQRKCFVWVDPILISQILAKWNCLFRRGNLQCGQLLHYWSDTLKSYLVQTLQSRKMDILKIWSQFIICKVILEFPPSLSCCSDSAANRQYITGLTIYYYLSWQLVTENIAFCSSILRQNIDISFGPNGAPLGALWWSTLRSASRSY